MAYEPTTWASGDTITSTKLNKIEQGIANGGGVFLVNGSTDNSGTVTLDKTAGEIWSALQNGIVLCRYLREDETILDLCAYATNNEFGYTFRFYYMGSVAASSANDYPYNQGIT